MLEEFETAAFCYWYKTINLDMKPMTKLAVSSDIVLNNYLLK
jgi:hypothetical protein